MNIQNTLLALLLLGISTWIYAQPPGGRRGGGPGFDPKEMVDREKQTVLKKIKDLSEDQIILIEGIYDEFGTSFIEIRDEARKERDFEKMRTNMLALNEEKHLLMKDLLNPDQYEIYSEIMKENEERRKEQRAGRGN